MGTALSAVDTRLASRLKTTLAAFAEDCAAYPDDGGALGDGVFEIGGHTHRKMGPGLLGKRGGEILAQFTEAAEYGAQNGLFVDEWGDGHEPVEAQGGFGGDGGGETGEFVRMDAVLVGVAGEIHLDEDGLIVVAVPVEGAGETQAVDGLDEVEERGGDPCFVTLQVADEVPADAGGGGRDLGLGFLDAVFTQVAEADGVGGFDDGQFEGLGDGDGGYVGGVAAGACGGGGDALLDAGVVGADGFAEGGGGDGEFPVLNEAMR